MITFLPSCCPIAALSSPLAFCKPLLWTSPRWAGGNVQGKGLHETQFPVCPESIATLTPEEPGRGGKWEKELLHLIQAADL